MASYFSYFPNIEYVSRTTDRSSAEEYIAVKNIFRRAKIRNDFYNGATAFEDYKSRTSATLQQPDQCFSRKKQAEQLLLYLNK